jgi:hypothetical protein
MREYSMSETIAIAFVGAFVEAANSSNPPGVLQSTAPSN